MTKTIYCYSAETGEFIGASEAHRSPLEKDVWLISEFTTEIAPPAFDVAAHEAVVFSGDGWTVVPDWRDVPLYATADGSPLTITKLGKKPDDIGATPLPRPDACHTWQDNAWVLSADATAAVLSDLKAALCRRIDGTADAARLAVAGDPLRAAEYQLAEAEAKSYQAAGYAGECPQSIKSWAEAKGWTSKQAADNIIAEAAAWNAGLYAIRDARLKAKEGVRSATTADAANAIAKTAIDGINAKVANLGNAAA